MAINCRKKIALLSAIVLLFSLQLQAEESTSLPVYGVDIQALTDYPSRGLTNQSLQAVVSRSVGVENSKISFDQVQEIADELTHVFRNAGFKFHSVYIAPQNLSRTKAIKLNLLAAILGDIAVRGPDEDLNKTIKALFEPLLQQTLYQPDIDEIVLLLKEQYGVNAFAYYSRGRERGEVRLNVKASRTKRGIIAINADNFGNEDSGKDRTLLSTTLANTFTEFDQLSLGAQRVVDGENSTFGYLSYDIPLFSLKHRLGFSASNNVFDVGGEFTPLEIEGDASLGSLRYSYTPSRSIKHTHQLSVSLHHKTSDYENALNAMGLTQDETVNTAEIGWNYRYQSPLSSSLYSSDIIASSGSVRFDDTGNEETFTKYRFNQFYETSFGDISKRWVNTFRGKLKAQYSDKKLPSFELVSMTGAYSVRGFYSGYFSADRGGILSLEWWWPMLFDFGSSDFRFVPFVFADYGYGERLNAEGLYDSHVELSSAGLGLQTVLFRHIVLTATGARGNVIERKNNPIPDEQDTLLQLNLNIAF